MSFRISAARFLLRLGSFIQTLPLFIMKTDDLVEFSRQSYARQQSLEGWGEANLVDSGLAPDELDLLSDIPQKTGELLLLGVGGGREAISLAMMGFNVTGVDYVAAMVDRAKENAAQRGFLISGFDQEISKLDVPAESYDVIWISRSMYSCVPTRERRVEMVRRIEHALKPGGYFFCQYYRELRSNESYKVSFLKRMIAFCTFGNLKYEEGDILHLNVEFAHKFNSDDALRSELEEGGLKVTRIQTDINPFRGGAVCRKAPVIL